MKSILTLAASAALVLGATGLAMADHGNPWAQEGDTVLSQNHETNQAFSADRPGEDEMRGALTRNAFGKTGGSSGKGADKGGKGKGPGEGKGGKGRGH
ncbi:hypothetical protein [Thetidibacter halocola]|uniref:Uncharacterized protein n=1 Tax=Thetidibacter halocola TaxID=2827239 RepID=A0A8J7WBN3_9RHOB|nr:hypothetical protein [Thetidibacter halocola]MBS0122736.1 hypothetical protein [Thetidibacter halocola]